MAITYRVRRQDTSGDLSSKGHLRQPQKMPPRHSRDHTQLFSAAVPLPLHPGGSNSIKFLWVKPQGFIGCGRENGVWVLHCAKPLTAWSGKWINLLNQMHTSAYIWIHEYDGLESSPNHSLSPFLALSQKELGPSSPGKRSPARAPRLPLSKPGSWCVIFIDQAWSASPISLLH